MGQAQLLEPGPETRATGLGLVSGCWIRPGTGPGQPWARPRLQVPGPAHVSAALAVYVYVFYANPYDFVLFYNILHIFTLLLFLSYIILVLS